MYNYTGSLFEERFERLLIANKKYLLNCIRYVHQNPEKHGFVDHFEDYNHSSYNSHLSKKQTKLMRMSVLEIFGGSNSFRKEHLQNNTYEKEMIAVFEKDEF